jgi:hypothetical protein
MRGSDGRSVRSYFGIALLPATLSRSVRYYRRVCQERVSKPTIILRHTSRYPVTVSSMQQSLKRGRCYIVGRKPPLCGTIWIPASTSTQALEWGLSVHSWQRKGQYILNWWKRRNILMNSYNCVDSEWLCSRRSYFTEFPGGPMCSPWLVMSFFSSEQDWKAQACTLYGSVKWRADCRTVWKRPAPLRRRAQEMHLVCRSRHVV